MMFNGGMYGGYAPNMSQSYMPNYGTPSNLRYNAPQSVSAQRCEIIRVNGKEGAEAYPMAQNSSILLLDENNPAGVSPFAVVTTVAVATTSN